MPAQSVAPLTASPESSRLLSPSPWRTALLLFLFLNFAYLLTSTGKARCIDEIDPVLQSESLLLRHSTAIPQAINSDIYFGKRDVHGIPRSAWPFGHAFMVLPWSAVGHFTATHLTGIPRSSADLWIMTVDCWSSATFAAIAAAASFLIFLALGLGRTKATICSLLVAFSTPLFVYSGWLYSEPASAALFMAAAFLLFASGKPVSTSRVTAGALLLAFSIHVRPANLVTVLVFIAAALAADFRQEDQFFRYRTALILILVVGVSGAIYLARNQALFGNPFDFGVPTTAENGKDLDSWHNPLWLGLAGYLFSPGKSVFLFCPPIILGILGLSRLYRRNRALFVLAAGAPLVNLVLYSVRTQWEGGYCYGPRYLLPSLLFLCLPIGALFLDPPRWLRSALVAVAVSGLLVQAIGLATNVIEDMTLNHYYAANWNYRFGYSPITGQLSLIWKYLHVPAAAAGLGWDRWFVLLRAGGVNPSLLTGIASLFLCAALGFGLLTWKSVRKEIV